MTGYFITIYRPRRKDLLTFSIYFLVIDAHNVTTVAMIIENQDTLDKICHELAQAPYLTIDTEFLRDKTYFSKLCLIQMAGPDTDAVALDPITTDLDWTPFHDLMQNKKVIKVFHAARQDLEIFYQMNGNIPTPIFDTQVAAMVCGYGDQIAYSKLVQGITGKSLPKNAQFTDWSRRPLSSKQMRYALDDVVYLRQVYETLNKQLIKQKRTHWVEEEMDILTNPQTYEINPQTVWERVKIRSDKPEVLAILRALAKWREEKAIKKNLPRGRILKDETLADIALYMPKDTNGLKQIRSLPNGIADGHTGKHLLKLIAQTKNTNPAEWPTRSGKAPFPKEKTATLEMLKLLLKINCAQAGVAPKLVANAKDLEKIALSLDPENPIMKGWRGDIFGHDAQELMQGDLMFTLENDQIKKIKK